MDQSKIPADGPTASLRVSAGDDRFGETRGRGVSTIQFKVVTSRLLALENTLQGRGGPPRHLHHEQDEWFYAIEGEFLVEVGAERYQLYPGDSLLAPQRVPHVWAHLSEGRGRILIAFTPAGQMEAYFRLVTQTSAMPREDPALWRAHGMELLGPPLVVE